jgi:tripartite ATP-independent transporter DctP family solute receptor
MVTRRFTIGLLAGAATLLAASSAGMAADKTFRLGYMFSATTSWGKALQRFADLVKEESGGRYEIRVFPDGQLGQERESLEALQLGNLDFFMGGPGVLANFDPKISIFDLPFLFQDYEHSNRVMDGPSGEAVFESVRKNAGIRVLASGAQGFRYVLTRKPINAIADLRGVKIRTPEAPAFIQAFRLLGANPVGVPWLETYNAFQGGVVDGMEGTPDVMRNFKMYEIGKNVARTGHIMATLQLLVSEKAFSALPPTDQSMMKRNAMKAWGEGREAARKDNEAAEADLQKAGVTFTNPDLKPFREAVRPLWAEWGEKHKAADLIEAIQK